MKSNRVRRCTPEQYERYRARHAPNPEHTAKLKAGIAEFRSMLERRYAR